MKRRKYTATVNCAHEGCNEWARYEYDNRADAVDASKRRFNRPWTCTRHTRPQEVLSPTNLERVTTLSIDEEKSYGKFWNGSHGFIHGNGYKAYADDFPVGTKIIVTAKVILPAQPTEPSGGPQT